MNNFPSQKTVEQIRKQYQSGCRVELVRMDDVQAPPIGTKGTVVGVDDTGSIMIHWDNGSTLNVVYGEDLCRKIDESSPGQQSRRKEEIPMWREGSIKVGNSIIRYWVKHFEESSQYGIEEGRISKLMLKRNGKIIANYDRGWDVKPVDSDAEVALALLMKKHN